MQTIRTLDASPAPHATRKLPDRIGLVLMFAIFVSGSAAAESNRSHPAVARPNGILDYQLPDENRRTGSDDLYRRRGYGTGGLIFGFGQGGTAQAGACADLGFARPRSCGPRGGYGIYGNGLGYGFGFR